MIQKYKLAASVVPAMALIMIIGLNFEVYGQRTTRTRKAPTVRTTDMSSPNDVRAAAEAVSIQIKNVSKFVFVLGGVAKGIEDLDKQIREGKATREIADQNRQFKDDVLRSIRALRAGLVKLEVDFRAKPLLKKYLVHIQGITDQSGRAEDLALAGRFSDSGKELLLIVEKLADTLVEMP